MPNTDCRVLEKVNLNNSFMQTDDDDDDLPIPTQNKAEQTSDICYEMIDDSTQIEAVKHFDVHVQTDCQIDIKSDGNDSNDPASTAKQVIKSSPGHGFWRSQIDYVCKCLKVQVKEDPDFRSRIADFELKRLKNCEIKVDENGEVELALKFNSSPKIAGKPNHLGLIEQENLLGEMFLDLYSAQKHNNNTEKCSKDTKTFPSKRVIRKPNYDQENSLISKLKKFKSAPDNLEVAEDLNEHLKTCIGNPNFQWLYHDLQSGSPILFHAIRAKHLDTIEFILSIFESVNNQCDSENRIPQLKDSLLGNTALHEVVLHWPENLKLFDSLINIGCSWKEQNKQGISVERLVERLKYKKLSSNLVNHQVRKRAFNFINLAHKNDQSTSKYV